MQSHQTDLKHQPFSVRAAAIITTIFLFVLPIAYFPGYGSFTAFRFFLFGTVSLLLLLFTVWIWMREPGVLKAFFRSWLSYGLIAYWLAFTLVSITSTDPAVSFFSSILRTDGAFTIFFLTIFALNCYTLIALGGQKLIRRFLMASVWGAVLLSILIMVLSGAIFKGGGPIGNSSLAASYVVWNVAFAVYLLISASRRSQKIWWSAALLAILLSSLFVDWKVIFGILPYDGFLSLIGTARGALLGLIIGAICSLLVWLSLHSKKAYAYVARGLLSLFIIGIVAGAAFLLTPSSTLHQKFIEHTTESRFIFWDISKKAFFERPVLGWGPGTYSTPYHKFFNPRMLMEGNPREVIVDKPHNIFFESLVNGGIVLTAAFVFFLVTILLGILKIRKYDKWLMVSVLGGFVAWFIQAQFVFDSLVSLVMLFLVASFACAATVGEVSRSRNIPGIKQKIILAVVGVLVLVLFTYVIVLPNKKSRLFSDIYNTALPARATLWPNLAGISPMGDQYDSVFTFNQVYEGYRKNLDAFRDADPLIKRVLVEEIDNVTAYIDLLLEKRPEEYELILTGARLRHVRMLLTDSFKGEVFRRANELATKAILLSPTDPRAHVTAARIKNKLNLDSLVLDPNLQPVQ